MTLVDLEKQHETTVSSDFSLEFWKRSRVRVQVAMFFLSPKDGEAGEAGGSGAGTQKAGTQRFPLRDRTCCEIFVNHI